MARRRLAALSAGILALVVALMGAATAPPAAAIVGGAVAPPGATPSIVAMVDPQLHFQFCGGTGTIAGWGTIDPAGTTDSIQLRTATDPPTRSVRERRDWTVHG